jgi:hypothetical protein
MVKGAADDGEVALIEGQQAVLDAAVCRARTQIEHLKIPVPIHAHFVAIVHGKKQHVYRARRVKRPDVDAFGIDLRLNQVEVVAARIPRQLDTARQAAASVRWRLGCGEIPPSGINAR